MKIVNSAKTILTIWVCIVLLFVFSGEVSAQKNKNKNRDIKKPTKTDSKPTPTPESPITKPNTKKESTKNDTTPRKKIVVVLDFKNLSFECRNDIMGKNVAAQLTAEFFKIGNYTVIEEQGRDDIIKKNKLSQEEIFEPKTAAKVGKLLSANAVFLGDILECNTDSRVIKIPIVGQMLTRTVKVSLVIKLVDINTSEVQDAVRISESASDRSGCVRGFGCTETALTQELIIRLFNEAVKKAVKKSVKDLTSIIDGKSSPKVPITPTPTPTLTPKTKISFPRVAVISGKIVYLTGLGQDVKVGDLFSVLRGIEIKDPGTGEIIDFDGKEIAKVEVIEVRERTVKAKIIQGTLIKENDVVKRIQ